jgi:hypothetical protein
MHAVMKRPLEPETDDLVGLTVPNLTDPPRSIAKSRFQPAPYAAMLALSVAVHTACGVVFHGGKYAWAMAHGMLAIALSWKWSNCDWSTKSGA